MCVPSIVQQNKYKDFLQPPQAKRIILTVAGLFIFPALLFSAGENNGRGAKAIGMANAFVAVADNPWAIQYNPAGLSRIPSLQISGFIIPQQFDMPELRTTALAMALPLKEASLGAAIDRFGFDLYNETTVSIGTGTALSKNIFCGVALNYHRLAIAGYGSTGTYSADAGVLAEIIPSVMLGGCFKNITNASVVKGEDDLPQIFSVGVAWKPMSDLLLTSEIEKDIRYAASIKAGIEKTFFNLLALRFGIANNPDKYSAGFAVTYAGMEFGYAGYSHTELGWTHQIELSFQFNGGMSDEETP
jgi:hypothetical protein